MSEIVIENVRFSYLNAFEPRLNKAGVPKYAASILIAEDNVDALEAIEAAIDSAIDSAIEKGELPAAQRKIVLRPLRNGTDEFMMEKRDSTYKGFFFFNAYSDNKPGIVDEAVKPIMKADLVYSGMWGNVAVNFYFTKKGGEPRVAVGLNHIMKTKDDERLDGRTNVEEAFAKYLKNKGNAGSKLK